MAPLRLFWFMPNNGYMPIVTSCFLLIYVSKLECRNQGKRFVWAHTMILMKPNFQRILFCNQYHVRWPTKFTRSDK